MPIVREEGIPVKKRRLYSFLVTIFCLLLLLGSLNLVVPRTASAEQSNQIEITGDGVVTPRVFTMAQLQAMEQYQHVYSTINTWPTKKWYVGKGVKLRELLALAGIKEDAKLINFISNDGYTVTLTVKELLKDKRYYFPHLKENHPSDGSIPGSPAEAKEVEPIIALLSAEGSNDPADMNDMNALMFMCGQRAVTEQTNNLFLKYVSKIEVLTTAPAKWDKPKANISSGEVSAGTLIELINKSSDSDKIYYTTDGTTPTVNSPIFNWSASRWWGQRPDTLKSINKPIEIKEDMVIKARTIGPGKDDSDVVTFSYKIGDTDNAGGQAKLPPTDVTLDEDIIKLKIGGSFKLAATVEPYNAIDNRVTWSSSDTRVATVDHNGLVTLVGPGTAVITVKTVTGNLTATCIVESVDGAVSGQRGEPVGVGTGSQKPESQEPFVKRQEDNRRYLAEKESVVAGLMITDESNEPSAVQKIAEPPVQEAVVSSEQSGKSGRVFEVSVDTLPLQVQIDESNLSIYQLLVFLLLFFSGAGKKYTECMREVAR